MCDTVVQDDDQAHKHEDIAQQGKGGQILELANQAEREEQQEQQHLVHLQRPVYFSVTLYYLQAQYVYKYG